MNLDDLHFEILHLECFNGLIISFHFIVVLLDKSIHCKLHSCKDILAYELAKQPFCKWGIFTHQEWWKIIILSAGEMASKQFQSIYFSHCSAAALFPSEPEEDHPVHEHIAV
ncbi:hypothetical protein SAY86_029843 [Trapa natans]|uniref:Uncharacterized protein n=1 Tax=Trapa natans TaxID=22666 RepID=A0AAN7M427_TRANT|nr:hypothetical protein SAY86_029843 [Trapa natans]